MTLSSETKEYIVVSDTDGVLFFPGYGMPGENLEALEAFVGAGGRYTLCTYRCYESVRRLCAWLPVNVPVVLDNGAFIVDMESGDVLYSVTMLPCIRQVVGDILRVFFDLGAEITVEPNLYVPRLTESVKAHLDREHMGFRICEIDMVPEGWHKVILFGSEADCIAAGRYAYLQQNNREDFAEFDYVVNTPGRLEIIPKDCSKVGGIDVLCELIGADRDKIVAVGGTASDIDVVKTSALRMAVADAPKEVRNSAQVVVNSCLRGGMAEALSRIDALVSTFEQTRLEL